MRVAPKARARLDDRERQYRIEEGGLHERQNALFGQPRVAAIALEVVVEMAHERAALERNGRTRQAADAAGAGPQRYSYRPFLFVRASSSRKRTKVTPTSESAVAEAITVPSGEKAKVVEPP